jgi:hypothetical protein
MFSLSTWLFYVADLILATAYLVIAALSFLPGGVTGKVEQSPLMRWLGIAFFVTCGVLHADMAVHAALLEAFFDPFGHVARDLTAIVCVQMVAVLSSLGLIWREKRRQRRQR